MSALFSEVVLSTDEARREFETSPVVLSAIANGLSVERYRKLLLELFNVVWHFNPICALAASRLTDQHRAVRYFLYEHMQEEAGHEAWVMNDLQAVGVSEGLALSHQASSMTLAMNGYNYSAADRRHPCSVLGMMYTFEVVASVYGGPFAAAIRESLLLGDDRGVSFISSHATMDAMHMVALRKILDSVMDPLGRAAVIESTKVNFYLLTRLFESV
jgi:pyrroloquinoline quinone (PQQ) biosynthesis protein C